MSPRSRIAVTGVGAVSAWGWDTAALERGLFGTGGGSDGPAKSATTELWRFSATGHRTRIAAQAGAPPAELSIDVAGWTEMSLAERFAVAAVREALSTATGHPEGRFPEAPAVAGQVAPLPTSRTGVFFGGSTAGMFETEEVLSALAGETPRSGHRPRFELLSAQPINTPAETVARMVGIAGPVETVSSACASGTQALGLALDALRRGVVEVALAGGADSLCRLTYAGFNALRVVDGEPCRPFRARRAGMNLGEGAGVLVLEPWERAVLRGAPILGELLGVGNSCDGHHMTAPHPQGLGAALAVRRALEDARVGPEEIDFVNAHGTGTSLNDASEWEGFLRVFGEERARQLPLAATKASVGHLLGSSGALEAVATLQCFARGAVHPAPPAADGDDELGMPARLVLGRPLPLPAARLALSTSFGFGGANAAAVLGAPGRTLRGGGR